MIHTEESIEKKSWLERPIFSFLPPLTGEMLLFITILLLATISRFYDLGQRAMSHDETLHTFFSWQFSQGLGYQHTPLTHGPLLFHLTALTYLLFGASDFMARFPEAISSILTILVLWKWRKYLGKAGTLIAASIMLISPFMLYYGRYARNESFVALFGVLTLYAILRYFETGKNRYLILLTVATALHFTSKETAFIYTAQAMLFLGGVLVKRALQRPWQRKTTARTPFLIALSIGALLIGAAFGSVIFNKLTTPTDASQTSAPLLPGGTLAPISGNIGPISGITVLFLLATAALIAATIFLINGYGWKNIRKERSFVMLILLGTFVLPQLAAFPAKALGWDPLAYQFTWPGWNLPALWAQAPVRTAVVFAILTILSGIIGCLWDTKRWFVYAAIFWGIYIFFYTSAFSNWQGFFTGSVGSLGYWLAQQGVHRGGQPWYYYLLIQIPIYEFLPAFGLCLAVILGIRKWTAANNTKSETEAGSETTSPGNASSADEVTEEEPHSLVVPLLVWWAFSSFIALSIAGEKMPWLTVHITLPMILLTGWALEQVIEKVNWKGILNQRGVLVASLWAILILALGGALISVLGNQPPFQGKALDQLSATNHFLLFTILALGSAAGLYILTTRRAWREIAGPGILVFFGLLAGLTARTAYRAAYVNYDNAMEYLVYAHGARGIQDVMDQVALISSRISGEKNLQIAYDNNLPKQGVSWSFKWYLRDYPNAVSFNVPDDSLKDVPVIIVDVNNFSKIQPIIGDNYYKQDLVRMVWPNQDYFNLTWPKIIHDIKDPNTRQGIINIWLNRDFSTYAAAIGKTGFTQADWQPSDRMQLFIRKDIAAQMWEYGISPVTQAQTDPYEKAIIDLSASQVIGDASQMNSPRGLAVMSDNSLLVADSRNNRILHFDPNGKLLQIIGETSPGCPYQQLPPPNVPLGTFCEPWAVAVSPDGQWIYVADTWNHRIQKLTADGKAVKTWGTPNYDPASSEPYAIWGPRGIAVDAHGKVFVADTGNKRILIYDADGNFIFQFGGGGISPGQMEEPVGLAFDAQGNLYVADTWNQRIQVFAPNADGNSYYPTSQWAISGWNGESLDNKPYLAVDPQGNVFAADPEGFRVLEFGSNGNFLKTWGSYGTGLNNFGLVSGIVADHDGYIWVSDTANNRIMRFKVP